MAEQPKYSKERPKDSCAYSTTEFHEVRTSCLPTDDPVLKERQRIARERFAKRKAEEHTLEEAE